VDSASPLIRTLFLNYQEIAAARLYEYSGTAADRVQTLQIFFTTLKVVHHATTPTGCGCMVSPRVRFSSFSRSRC
jgi:hypothetical protein